MVDWCFSGGARGADTIWGECALAAGHKVCHFSFQGHQANVAKHLMILSPVELAEADRPLQIANQTLKRQPFSSRSDHVRNLLRRNYFQIRNADSCYAVSSLDARDRPRGGTAWAVQMFLDKHDGAPCPCYFFEQGGAGVWLVWGEFGWERTTPPRPSGIYTGIGTRHLNAAGENAIRSIFA